MTPARRVKPMDDDGAQAAEYAMLGGVSAAAASSMILVYTKRDALRSLVDFVVEKLGDLIGRWF